MTAFSGAFAATITPAENTATKTTAKSVANFFIPAHPLPVCGLQREIAPRAPFGFLASAQIGEPLFDFFEVPAARPGREPLRPSPDPPLGAVVHMGLVTPAVVVPAMHLVDFFDAEVLEAIQPRRPPGGGRFDHRAGTTDAVPADIGGDFRVPPPQLQTEKAVAPIPRPSHGA